MDLLSIAILLFLAVGLVAYSLFPRRGEKRELVKRRLEGRRVASDKYATLCGGQSLGINFQAL